MWKIVVNYVCIHMLLASPRISLTVMWSKLSSKGHVQFGHLEPVAGVHWRSAKTLLFVRNLSS